jgi:hypothetical protein
VTDLELFCAVLDVCGVGWFAYEDARETGLHGVPGARWSATFDRANALSLVMVGYWGRYYARNVHF